MDWNYLKYDIEGRWEQITEKLHSPREWLNQQNPKTILGIFAFCAAILLLVGISQCRVGDKGQSSRAVGKAWFYDLNTRKLFTAPAAIPPVKAPSGPLPNGEPAGVAAYVFSYAAEANESNRFIAYLEKYTPEAKERITKLLKTTDRGTKESLRDWDNGRLISDSNGSQWLDAKSSPARAIILKALSPNENGDRPRPVMPK